MRCEYCHVRYCSQRLTAGPCNDPIYREIDVYAPDTAPLDAGALAHTTDGLIVEELRIKFNPILRAASDLVDAVEKYVNPKKGEFLHRSELLIKVKELKEILK